jgi:hypothetical protein
MSLRAGFVCYTAPPAILRSHALAIYRLRTSHGFSSYHPLAEHKPRASWHSDGELQLLGDFDDDVSAAVVARREVVGDDVRTLASDEGRRAVWHQKDAALARLREARVRRR